MFIMSLVPTIGTEGWDDSNTINEDRWNGNQSGMRKELLVPFI